MKPRRRHVAAGGTRGSVFREVARVRLEDAQVLLDRKRFSGAIYLAGYAIECILKWRLTLRKGITYLPDKYETHDWALLLAQSGLQPELQRQRNVYAIFSHLAEMWAPELRYRAKQLTEAEAEGLYGQMSTIYAWIAEQV